MTHTLFRNRLSRTPEHLSNRGRCVSPQPPYSASPPLHPPPSGSSKDAPSNRHASLHMVESSHTGRRLLPKNSNKNKAEKGPKGQMSSPLNECLPRKSSQSLYKTNVHVDFWTSNPLGCRSLYYQAAPGSAAPDVPEVESGAIP